ncbi:MAG: electron transfer flavoprotein subunit beta/FixA family protein [bacterium]|nr:electron transfer flavoprotein subunit beta/FixA family protein [Acidimicrobiia bacterium]MCY4649062.1 electron transfer flavoprotein subunit beta/FixA family protein [bacterium]
MNILVCVKRVPAPGARIVLTDDRQDIDTRHLGFTTSPHEECAVEAAVQLRERHGGTATVLTLGPPEAVEQLRYSVSVGADQVVLVPADTTELDPQATAAALVDAITELESGAPFDLILFGNESADSGGYQVGIRVARALGRPVISGLKGIEIDGDEMVGRRETDEGFEVYRLPLPAVAAAKEGITLPRYPTLPGRLKSRRAQITEVAVEFSSGGQEMVHLLKPTEEVTETVILGHGAEAAPQVVRLLEEVGLL